MRSSATSSNVSAAGTVQLRFTGTLHSLSAADRTALFDRSTSTDDDVRMRTAAIIRRVRLGGDAALRELAGELDGVELDALEVPRQRCQVALETLDPGLRSAMERSAANIAAVHSTFLPRSSRVSPEPGIVIERRPDPLARVGVYAPGGRATYPSSVLMGAVPARVAGVREVVLCTPPSRDGLPDRALLAAAALAGVDRVFALGGAGAIAALAFGTETVPRVDRVVGPGNAYVAEAKLQLAGTVAIDSPAGPSELLVIADDACDPVVIAREMVAQAEHDPLACAVAVIVGNDEERVVRALGEALAAAGRRDIVTRALAGQGGILLSATLDEAVEFATRYSPEHLLVALGTRDSCSEVAIRVRNAGTVFVGATASNAFGDYLTGANHVLPTGGLARSYSGLSTLDFVRWITIQHIDRGAAARLAVAVGRFADAESLPGHAAAARAWASPASRVEESASGSAMLFGRPEIAALPLYTPGPASPHCDVDLSDNINLWGMPPAARAALPRAADLASRYPSAYSEDLKERLTHHIGLPGAGIVTGCGSDDVINATMRALAVPGARVAFSVPTFSMVPTFARINGLIPLPVPLGDADHGYDLDVDALLATGAELIYVCAPNNPTGTAVSREAVERVVANAPGVVLLDEAYAEFAGASCIDLVARSDRLLVTRTFSKAFGLAGLRIGYGVAAPPLAQLVERARGPYKVTSTAERCAIAALGDGPDALEWVRAHAVLASELRDRFAEELRSLSLAPLPSVANFVLVPDVRAARLGAALRERRVLVRVLSGLPTQLEALDAARGNALRIGIGPWNDMQRALDALRVATAAS